ncbi:hypothetical protein NM208_g4683 [Fusarium decemcellulare]|uniref:Uncharacterized protein n=2 Tax=Fusarium decemcellulare TaxID=57161 RepID=A0ACC1SFP8_9HYPO|nr:hypothetical protein NM208_g5763 [Fusarium decemcellulare]KAJ3541283.1 hypothetical protein NM208_g4683 [Fusarium decemcellulare]
MSMTTHLRDIELATSGIDPTPHDAGHTWAIASFRSLGAFISETFHRSAGSQAYEVFQGYQIEDQPTGYPQFSSLMASHENFQIFRRFSNVRTRLALLAQDRVTQLDSRLREIDETEASPIFLASSRTDRNEERQLVQAELRDALKDYDEMLERAVRISVLGTAQPQDVTSLQNWNDLTAGMSREETEFLTHREDLLCLSVPGDGLLSWLERYISERLLSLSKHYKTHAKKTVECLGYSRVFISDSAMVLHLESGYCQSGADEDYVNEVAFEC